MKFLKLIYEKLFLIDDTPPKIAAGMGLGVFFGVMPAMGPVIATFFAVVLKVNRAAALIGSLLTNTWMSVPAFFAAVVIGAAVTGSKAADITVAWSELWKSFTWQALGRLSFLEVILPVIAGYVIVSLLLALLAYAGTLAVLHYAKSAKGGRIV